MQRTTNTTAGTGAANAGMASFEESGRALAQSKDELMREFRNLIRDGESLLRSTTSVSGDALAQAREQFRTRLEEARKRISEASRVAAYAVGRPLPPPTTTCTRTHGLSSAPRRA